MALNERRQGNTIIWDYERLRIFGRFGTMEGYLEDLHGAFQEDDLEFGPVIQKEMGEDFMAAFSFRPIADVTFSRRISGGETAVLLCSLDENKSPGMLDYIFRKGGIREIPIREDIARGWYAQFSLTGPLIYDQCNAIAQLGNMDLGRAFSIVHYSQLLNYKGVSGDDAIHTAAKKFGYSFR